MLSNANAFDANAKIKHSWAIESCKILQDTVTNYVIWDEYWKLVPKDTAAYGLQLEI